MAQGFDGGYDDGYSAVPAFWGREPGSLVSNFIGKLEVSHLHVLDVGAGEGKNAAAFSRSGASVDAVECSVAAIANGKKLFADLPINWINENALEFEYGIDSYDVIICYGLLHCLSSSDQVSTLISNLRLALRAGGTLFLVAFNSGSQDLSAHPGFTPLLLDHSWYLDQFADWTLVSATNSLLFEVHPHNNIPHHHSMTRIEALKP